MNSKKLFILALGLTASINIFTNIDNNEIPSLQNNSETALVATLLQPVVKNTDNLDNTVTNLEETSSLRNDDTRISTLDPKTISQEITDQSTLISISLEEAQAFNIEGLELKAGTIFTCNGINYIIANPVDVKENNILETISQE